MSERRTLRCPHCGAPLPPESLRGPATCAFCGITSAPADDPATIEAAHLDCPRCATALFEGKSGDVTLLGCGRCGGIWLDNESARSALAKADEGVAQLAQLASVNAQVNVSVMPPVACPVCKRGLQRIQEPKSEARIDVCGEHGTWFDRYELGLVLQAAHQRAAAPTTYGGATPDFREGANTEVRDFLTIFATGTGAILAGAVMADQELEKGKR
jgi:Zn-finger nucleic acid-binding protein